MGVAHPVAAVVTLAFLVALFAIVGTAVGYLLHQHQSKLPCCQVLRSSELDEVLVAPGQANAHQSKVPQAHKQAIALSASTTISVENQGYVSLHQGIPIGGQFMRTSSIELGDIYRTASAISVLLEEADARPFINRLMSMPAMNADGIATRQVIDASTINPNIEVSMDEIDLAEQIGKGGFGAVYKGTWRGAPVAVKYAVCNVQDADSIESAIREVVLSKKMSHPHVVQTYAWTILDGPTSEAAKHSMPQRDVLQRALHTSKANPSAAAAAATSGRSAVPLKALHASRINLVSHPLISAHSGGSSQDLLFSPASSVHEAVIPRRVRKHRRSSLGPGRYDEAPMPEEPNQRRSDHGTGHKPIRKSSSLVGLRELAELSRHQLLVPDQGSRQLSAQWEQELVKMKLASSSFDSTDPVRPSSTGSEKSTEQPGVPRVLPPVSLETALTAALTCLSPQPEPTVVSLAPASEQQQQQQQQQAISFTSDRSLQQDQSQELGLATRRSITSPFLAAAQRFSLSSPPLSVSDQQDDASSDHTTPRNLVPPHRNVFSEALLTPSTDPVNSDPPELAAEVSAGEQEAVLLALGGEGPYEPDDRFSLDNCDPRLDMRHSLATSPNGPQPAERFVTADSFKNEPGQTLFDCTDPTPNQSTDLDDAAFKARLAPFLPNLSTPNGKRIRRQLSSQFNSFASWPKSRHHSSVKEPDPCAIASADAELSVIDETGSAKGSGTGGRASERGHSMQSTGVNEPSLARSAMGSATWQGSTGGQGRSSPSTPRSTRSRRRSSERRRSSGAVYLKEMEVEVSGMSCASFNSEEGFGSPAARFNRERQNVFDLDDNEIKGHDTVIVVVMEFCDLGSLLRAVNKKAFKPHGKWSYHTTYRALLRTAQEIAKGMDYIHSFGIIHGDLKLGNVLLKTHRVDRRGYVAKVSDFGLSRPLQGSEEDVPAGNHVGTIMYTAPETFRDSRLTKPGDVYAFGIMMWEMFYCMAAYEGLMDAQICVGVCDGTLRPQFNETCPLPYQTLAMQCWAQSPEDRPTFLQLVETLTQIEIEFRRECRRQRPAMWGAAGGTPARRKSTGLGGIPIPHTHKPPSRFGSNVEKTNAESFSVAASPLMSTEVELGVDDSPIMTPRGR